MSANNFKETIVYKKAFELAMEIFEVSKLFPKEEKYSLQTRNEDHQEAYAQTWLKHTEKKINSTFYFETYRLRY